MSEKSCSNTSCDKSSCEGCPSKAKEQTPVSLQAECNEYSCVRRVIGVVSGKGGVGKSMVTASL
ncbi:MAG: ATP-binding protein, partial [Lachnospiraceae bacterium]|nr:ATP-binding protein [Lachnospiraceae bacterium]